MQKKELIDEFNKINREETHELNTLGKQEFGKFLQRKIDVLKEKIEYPEATFLELVRKKLKEFKNNKLYIIENLPNKPKSNTPKTDSNTQPKSPTPAEQPTSTQQSPKQQPAQQPIQPQNKPISNPNLSPEQVKSGATRFLPGLQKFYAAISNYKKMLDSDDFKYFDNKIKGFSISEILQGSQYISNQGLKQFGRIYDKIKNYISTFKDFQKTLDLSKQSIDLLSKAQNGDVDSYVKFFQIMPPLFSEINRFETLFESQFGNVMQAITANNNKIKFITHIALTGFSIDDAQMNKINDKTNGITYEDSLKILDGGKLIDKIKNIYNILNTVTQEVKEVKNTNVQNPVTNTQNTISQPKTEQQTKAEATVLTPQQQVANLNNAVSNTDLNTYITSMGTIIADLEENYQKTKNQNVVAYRNKLIEFKNTILRDNKKPSNAPTDFVERAKALISAANSQITK